MLKSGVSSNAGWRGAFALPKPSLEVYAGNQTMIGCTAEVWLETNAPIPSHPKKLENKLWLSTAMTRPISSGESNLTGPCALGVLLNRWRATQKEPKQDKMCT